LLPPPMQAKLLKVLEDQTVRRLGSNVSEPVDAAIISATNADLPAAVAAGHFREDLYHRLAVLAIELPPLRARGQDIVLLANRFLAQVCSEYGMTPKRLTAAAEARLAGYDWPGNIRELSNVMERVALLGDGDEVGEALLDFTQHRPGAHRALWPGHPGVGPVPSGESNQAAWPKLAAFPQLAAGAGCRRRANHDPLGPSPGRISPDLCHRDGFRGAPA